MRYSYRPATGWPIRPQGAGDAPFFDATGDDPVEKFVEEALAIQCSSPALKAGP